MIDNNAMLLSKPRTRRKIEHPPVAAAFDYLPRACLEAVLDEGKWVEYNATECIVSYGEVSTSVYFILSGLVTAGICSPQGREISYQNLSPGDMFGELAAIDQQPRSCQVLALQNCSILQLPGTRFLSLTAQYPELQRATLLKLARTVRFLCARVYDFGALDVSGRIRQEIIRLIEQQKRHDSIIHTMPTHQQLASRVATHREAVSRELCELERQGIILRKGRSLLITDLPRLKAMISA